MPIILSIEYLLPVLGFTRPFDVPTLTLPAAAFSPSSSRPDQTVIRVEAELSGEPSSSYSPGLNVSYSLEENEKSNIVHDVRIIRGKGGRKKHSGARMPK